MNEERQPGQSIILVAIMLLALTALAALAVDMTNVYFGRRTAQNGADAAALAGAEELALQKNEWGRKIDTRGDSWPIKAAMNDLAERNGIQDTDPTSEFLNDNVEAFYLTFNEEGELVRLGVFPTKTDPTKADRIPSNVYGIEAVTHLTATTFLGGALGWDGYPVSALAAVSIRAPVCGVTCVVPIATYWEPEVREFDVSPDPDWELYEGWTTPELTPFTCYNIWNGEGPGNFGWLNWTLQGYSCGENDCNEVCLGHNLDPDYCSGMIGIGDLVAGVTGVKTGTPVLTQLDKYTSDPTKLPDQLPQPFTVPLFTVADEEGGCGKTYTVSGFAKMQLIGYDLSQGGGATSDPWIDPLLCTNIAPLGEEPVVPEPGELPNYGNRLTAYFLDFVDPSSEPGECEGYGTITTIRITK